MNLEKIKELEDVKKELSIIGGQYNNLFKQKKTRYVISAHDDFKNFFKDKGFTIKENENDIEASYGEARVIIKKAKIEDSYMGSYAVWEIQCLIDKSNYTVRLNELDHYPTGKVTFGSPSKSDEEKLDKEIQRAKENVEDIKKRLEDFDTVKWGYGLIRESERMTAKNYPQFESMRELLGSMFN